MGVGAARKRLGPDGPASLPDLGGRRVAYNDDVSLSGYHSLRDVTADTAAASWLARAELTRFVPVDDAHFVTLRRELRMHDRYRR